MRLHLTCFLFAAALLLQPGAGFCADAGDSSPRPSPSPEKRDEKDAAREKKSEPAADPTQLSPRMRQALSAEKRAEVIKEPEAPRLPEISLKGLVRAGDSATAIIDVKGAGSHLVRAGSELSVTSTEGTLTMKVSKITADAVHIDVPAVKLTIIVR